MKARSDQQSLAKGTFEDAEMENLRSWQKLSFEEKLNANEEMNQLFNAVIKEKRANNQTFIDPETNELTN